MLTYLDAIENLISYLGAKADDGDLSREVRRAARAALTDLADAHNWTYYFKQSKVNLNAAFSEGTLAFTLSGGGVPRQWTLSGVSPVLPLWTADGYLRIADDVYRVDQRISDTVFTTTADSSPPADLASGTSFVLYQDSYLLPIDFAANDKAVYQPNYCGLEFVHPASWMRQTRYLNQVGDPRWYTITGDEKYPDRLLIRFFPYPGFVKAVDLLYRRSPRVLRYAEVKDGVVALTAGSTAIVGTGTKFLPGHAGTVIRVSAAPNVYPTSLDGDNPSDFEGVIRSVTDATHATVLVAPTITVATGKFVISDPIDIQIQSMRNAFERGAEKQIGMLRAVKDKPSARIAYMEALSNAKQSDSRTFMGRVVGVPEVYRQRLSDMPLNPSGA